MGAGLAEELGEHRHEDDYAEHHQSDDYEDLFFFHKVTTVSLAAPQNIASLRDAGQATKNDGLSH
jgi:hypothetical protein